MKKIDSFLDLKIGDYILIKYKDEITEYGQIVDFLKEKGFEYRMISSPVFPEDNGDTDIQLEKAIELLGTS